MRGFAKSERKEVRTCKMAAEELDLESKRDGGGREGSVKKELNCVLT